jgi:hypothetical protein
MVFLQALAQSSGVKHPSWLMMSSAVADGDY